MKIGGIMAKMIIGVPYFREICLHYNVITL